MTSDEAMAVARALYRACDPDEGMPWIQLASELTKAFPDHDWTEILLSNIPWPTDVKTWYRKQMNLAIR